MPQHLIHPSSFTSL
jgi:hypothetical protein